MWLKKGSKKWAIKKAYKKNQQKTTIEEKETGSKNEKKATKKLKKKANKVHKNPTKKERKIKKWGKQVIKMLLKAANRQIDKNTRRHKGQKAI
mgnify:CR=1 FL=1